MSDQTQNQTSAEETTVETETGTESQDTGTESEETGADTGETGGEEGTASDDASGSEEGGEGNKQPEPDYKEKFAASTRENQRIMSEKKALEDRLAEKETREGELQKLADEYKAVAESKNPDGAKLLELGNAMSKLQRELATTKEESDLDKYISRNPAAASVRESLRKLYRAEPKKSLDTIWDESFAPVAKATESKVVAKKETQKKTQPTSGKGGFSSDSGGGLPANFNQLPVAERREILRKRGY